MSLTVVGSVAFDALETPFGKRDKLLGVLIGDFQIMARVGFQNRVALNLRFDLLLGENRISKQRKSENGEC